MENQTNQPNNAITPTGKHHNTSKHHSSSSGKQTESVTREKNSNQTGKHTNPEQKQ